MITVSVIKGLNDKYCFVFYSTIRHLGSLESDFVLLNGKVTFQPGETVKSIVIKTYNDMTAEPMEHYLLKLISVSDNVPERDKAAIRMSKSTAELTSKYFAFGKTILRCPIK